MGGSSVSACLGEKESDRQFQETRQVFQVPLFQRLPRKVGSLGSEGSRQPRQVDDKMRLFIVGPMFQGCEFGDGIDGFLGGKPIPLIVSPETGHKFPTDPHQDRPTESSSVLAIGETHDLFETHPQHPTTQFSTRHHQNYTFLFHTCSLLYVPESIRI